MTDAESALRAAFNNRTPDDDSYAWREERIAGPATRNGLFWGAVVAVYLGVAAIVAAFV